MQNTDRRRAQLAEMHRIDKENAVQVMDNQKSINRQEVRDFIFGFYRTVI